MFDAAQKTDPGMPQTGEVLQSLIDCGAKVHDDRIDKDFRHEQIDEDDFVSQLAEFADFLRRKLADANQTIEHGKLA